MLVHGRGHADPAGLGERFQPRCDVDGIAEEVAVLEQYVAEVDADAEQHPPVRRCFGILLRDRLLDRERAGESIGDARELGEHGISGGVGDPPAVPCDQLIDDRAASGQRGERAVLVRTHQPAVLGDVGREDCRQPPLDAFRHIGALTSAQLPGGIRRMRTRASSTRTIAPACSAASASAMAARSRARR